MCRFVAQRSSDAEQPRPTDLEATMSEEVTFEASNLPERFLALALLALGFVAVALWVIGAFGEPPRSSRYPDWLASVCGWTVIPLCGARAAMSVRTAIRPGLAIRIDRNGLYMPRVSDEVIAWADIERVGTVKFKASKRLGFEVTRAREKQLRPMARYSLWFNRICHGHGVVYSFIGTDTTLQQVMTAMARFAPAELVH